jgi:putative transcriptional regulator
MTRQAFDKIARARGRPSQSHERSRSPQSLSQEDFAFAFGFTVHQMRQWEQGRSRPLGAERAFLMIIDRDPKLVLEMLHEAATHLQVSE